MNGNAKIFKVKGARLTTKNVVLFVYILSFAETIDYSLTKINLHTQESLGKYITTIR
jgi:hypothetical protein